MQYNETREVAHCRFLDWRDFFFPASTSTILNFIETSQRKQVEMVKMLGNSWTGFSWGPPIVIHCGAGYGRSGKIVKNYDEFSNKNHFLKEF